MLVEAVTVAVENHLIVFFNDTATTEIYTVVIFPYTTLFRSDRDREKTKTFTMKPDLSYFPTLNDDADRKSTRLNSSHP